MESARTLSMTSATLTRFDAKTGSPFILPVWSGFESVDSTHRVRIPFDIPDNLGVLQKVTVSFRGLPFRSGHQSTAAANTSGASSTSSSGASSSSTTANQSTDHDHTMTILALGAHTGSAVSADSSGGVLF